VGIKGLTHLLRRDRIPGWLCQGAEDRARWVEWQSASAAEPCQGDEFGWAATEHYSRQTVSIVDIQ